MWDRGRVLHLNLGALSARAYYSAELSSKFKQHQVGNSEFVGVQGPRVEFRKSELLQRGNESLQGGGFDWGFLALDTQRNSAGIPALTAAAALQTLDCRGHAAHPAFTLPSELLHGELSPSGKKAATLAPPAAFPHRATQTGAIRFAWEFTRHS